MIYLCVCQYVDYLLISLVLCFLLVALYTYWFLPLCYLSVSALSSHLSTACPSVCRFLSLSIYICPSVQLLTGQTLTFSTDACRLTRLPHGRRSFSKAAKSSRASENSPSSMPAEKDPPRPHHWERNRDNRLRDDEKLQRCSARCRCRNRAFTDVVVHEGSLPGMTTHESSGARA